MAVVYQPQKVRLDALRRAVAEAEQEFGWEPSRWYETRVDSAGRAHALQAIEEGADVVAAAGGDGTVREVAEGMRGTGIPMAIIPSGTGNLLARNLELPIQSDEAAVRIAMTGTARAIDLGMIAVRRPGAPPDERPDEHAFTIIAGIGLDANMIRNTRPELKRRIGWMAYFHGMARAVSEARPIRILYSIDGAPRRAASVYTAMIANCGMLPGRIQLMPEASLDDGVLDIAAVRPRGWFGWVRVWRTVVIENGVLRRSPFLRRIADLRSRTVEDVIYRRGRDVQLSVVHPQPVQCDGDDLGEAIAVHAWVEPHALLVKLPS